MKKCPSFFRLCKKIVLCNWLQKQNKKRDNQMKTTANNSQTFLSTESLSLIYSHPLNGPTKAFQNHLDIISL